MFWTQKNQLLFLQPCSTFEVSRDEEITQKRTRERTVKKRTQKLTFSLRVQDLSDEVISEDKIAFTGFSSKAAFSALSEITFQRWNEPNFLSPSFLFRARVFLALLLLFWLLQVTEALKFRKHRRPCLKCHFCLEPSSPSLGLVQPLHQSTNC